MRLAWLLLCLALPLQAGQTVYRRVDAQGVVHYSDQPQPGGQSETLQLATPPKGKPARPAPVQTSRADMSQSQEPAATAYTIALTSPKDQRNNFV